MPAPVRYVFDLLSSVRFGIVLLVVLFVYMSVGSAGIIYPEHPNILHPDAWAHDQLRQWRPFEMTEFEWFHWWPFDLMIGLLAANIVVTTLRRIPFKPVNFGVWMIHAGVIVLIVGSFIYFNAKVEGDAPVARRKIALAMADGSDTVEMLASPGAKASVGTGTSRYDVEVVSIDPSWEILTGDDAGSRAYSVTLMVQSPSRQFMRQLVDGKPEYTEDLILTSDPQQPMKRARKELGAPIVDDAIVMSMGYESQGWFYLRNDLVKSWAVYVRRPGESAWVERRVSGLPLYNDYIADRAHVFEAPGAPPLPIDPIDVPVPPTAEGDPFPDVTFRLTGFLRYAQTRSRLVSGASTSPLNPVATVEMTGPEGQKESFTLAAFDPASADGTEGILRLRWAPDEASFERMIAPPTLSIRIPEAAIDTRISLRDVKEPEADGQPAWRALGGEGTEWAWRLVAVQEDLPVGARAASVAVVEFRTPRGTIRRWVFDDPALTRDVPSDGGADPMHGGGPVPPDASIEAAFAPGSGRALVTLIAGPETDRLRLVSSVLPGEPRVQAVTVGQPLTLPAGLSMRVASFDARAIVETRPFVVPKSQRVRDARELFAQVRLQAPDGRSQWLEYSPYPFDDQRFALRRHPYRPMTVTLGDGRQVEVMFSRQRLPLPEPVALETFELATHIGGYTGDATTIRDYTSMLRFQDSGTGSWTAPVQVSVNDPVERKGLWYFQAQWDPPDGARFEGDRASMGLNYTVLGVGNREGVYIQLAGCVLATLGMIYAFYVKPMIRRRARAAVMKSMPGGLAAAALAMCAALAWPEIAPAQGPGAQSSGTQSAEAPFAAQVDLAPLATVAVQNDGRIKSFPSFAAQMMSFVSGPRRIAGQSPEFTYLDMMLRPEAYGDADVIWVKGAPVRAPIAEAIRRADPQLDERMKAFERTGLISKELLARADVQPVLRALESDLLRTAKAMDQVRGALAVMRPEYLLDRLRIVPASASSPDGKWHGIAEVMLLSADPDRVARAGLEAQPVTGIDEASQRRVADAWRGVVEGWTSGNAATVNASVAALADALHKVDTAGYPDRSRLEWESWYFANRNMTWVWLPYAIASVVLLIGVVYRWPRTRALGMALFAGSLLLQTAAVGLRWWIAQRWPNSNMFEAVTTASWFGAVAALPIEWWLRKRAAAGLVALAAGVSCAVALMAAHFLPVQLNPAVSNMMPVLHDVWLYIHTNVIIFSYCLIFMAAVTAMMYVVWRARGGAPAFARVGGGNFQWGTEGAGGFGEVLDGVTMLLMQASFVLLWAGIAMGAIWADHSWGRPWGWDPKEVFALNTFVVFAILVHVRLTSTDKGLWTAWLAVAGAAVMLFNWVVINFVITGLHSYA
jgi:cytochrome c-type biogenesis protein CcsB